MSGVKLCKDCKHSRNDNYASSNILYEWSCLRPNLVTGEPGNFQGLFLSCFDERDVKDQYHRCGPGAKYFEPKEVKDG